jgi:hypothetical protein
VPDFQPDRILGALAHYDVHFVLIGGLAATAHGSPHLTYDVDITPDTRQDNLARLSAALKELGARIRTQGVEGGLAFDHDAGSLAANGVWNLTTDFGDLDISLRPTGTDGFEDLNRSALSIQAYGLSIRIAALEDIIRSKQAADRDKDKLTLPTLREILANRER